MGMYNSDRVDFFNALALSAEDGVVKRTARDLAYVLHSHAACPETVLPWVLGRVRAVCHELKTGTVEYMALRGYLAVDAPEEE